MKAPILTAEEAFAGSLMWLPADLARRAHQWVQEDDLSSPALQIVHHLVGQLTEAGVSPDPAAVLSLAITEGHVEGPHRIGIFAMFLLRLYDHRATAPASVGFYARQALELAERRRVVEMSTRLAQIADHADLDELDRLRRVEQDAIDTIRARRAEIGRAA